jgi:hypothetical protein
MALRLNQYELEQHELALLVQACRTVTLLDRLDSEVRRGRRHTGQSQGSRVHPAAVEARQQSIALARIFGALRLPAGADGDHQVGARAQRRVGVRGFTRSR